MNCKAKFHDLKILLFIKLCFVKYDLRNINDLINNNLKCLGGKCVSCSRKELTVIDSGFTRALICWRQYLCQ